jgi:hypothetical protein
MAALTIRGIPDGVVDRIRALSERERRSLNKEFLVIVEEGLQAHEQENGWDRVEPRIPRDLQLALWEELAGSWQDRRPTSEIIADIRSSRTLGREVRL